MVKAWKEEVVIPTYECGEPEKNPIFLENRVYQGSSGVVYPYPVIESIANKKTPHTYQAVYLENEYLKIMILPELGGRVQMAYDKIKERHFIYYNHVVKPALVGLAGPWISGGIEFNWPQHHRPSTFMPVDCLIEEHADQSVTVWVNEMERMFHQKGMVGFTLRPGHAYLEIKGVCCNRTKLPQTFLWWANPAVSVNDYYRSVFPQDVNAVFDHGKRAVSTFPIATGTYYKMDYSAGVDISNYKNIKVPTSYMAVNSRFDFEGGYEEDTHGGMLHVANHHVSPGKKQWTWGNGDFGRAWDRNLTDNDGPYIELMAGVYTENQPDFSWLQPGEEKEFTQYFMPYRELGVVKNASKDLLLNIEPSTDGRATLQVMATSEQQVTVVVSAGTKNLYRQTHQLSPLHLLCTEVEINDVPLNKLQVSLLDAAGRCVLSWCAESDDVKRVPDAAEAPLSPVDTRTVEQLYLTGLHLEQYRHATWNPVDYYGEGLRREPLDVRCNNAMGLWYLRRGCFGKAEPYLRTAVKVLQKRNPNPYEGEPLYNLALCLKYQGKTDEAYDWFYKATWNGGWQNAAYFACAELSVARGDFEEALYEVNRSLLTGGHHHQARALKTAILRKMGRKEEALAFIRESLQVDHFNYGARFEEYLLTNDKTCLATLHALLHGNALNYHEVALDYAQAGLWKECIAVLDVAREVQVVTPMNDYYAGWAWTHLHKKDKAMEAFVQADQTSSYCCFPNRLEDVLALECASSTCPEKGKADYYLGCLYYDKRQYDVAIKHWETSAGLDGKFPTVWRNLALAAFNKEGEPKKALELMERAFSLDTTDSRVLMELDQLRKCLQFPYAKRLTHLQKYAPLVAQRDDLVLEEITLLNQTGRYVEAMHKLDAHLFHPWEGGEGKVPAQYQTARVEQAKRLLAEGQSTAAMELLEQCLVYPPHLGEGKLYGAQENDFYYLLGLAHQQCGNMPQARRCWQQATLGPTEPAAAMYYNDAKPDKIFYQGMAYRKLAESSTDATERDLCNGKANGTFYRLVTYGEKHLFDTVKMDYFAVSLPDLLIWNVSLQEKHLLHCHYLMALGYWGNGQKEKALNHLSMAEKADINHQGIQAFRTFMEWCADR